MSIVEKASEISENNATIAKNQQRVYEAGVRAGLAQDPDYAEGFEDGHAQGITDASGVIWEDLLSGEIAVGKALEADHAAEATHSINSDRSLLADKATEADHASTATNADHSATAGRAAEADHSDTATNATLAERATNANNADRADFAGHATTATQATSATTADIAKALDGVLPVATGGTGSGTVDGALAVLGLTLAANIAFGSYVGTGSKGTSDNPIVLTYDFDPKIIIFFKKGATVSTGTARYFRLPQAIVFAGSYLVSLTDDTNTWCLFTWGDKKVSWYGAGDAHADDALNALDETYYHLAIG